MGRDESGTLARPCRSIDLGRTKNLFGDDGIGAWFDFSTHLKPPSKQSPSARSPRLFSCSRDCCDFLSNPRRTNKLGVIGFRKGWFPVDAGPHFDLRPLDTDPDALTHPPPDNPNPYFGRGWVPGNMLTAWLLRNLLKQAPDEKSADVVDLSGDGSGLSDPQEVTMRRIIACSDDWVYVEVALEKDMKPLLATDAPKGAVRGWAIGSCAEQFTTCDFGQDRPWSPPAPLPPE
jgi:hypothetical protein